MTARIPLLVIIDISPEANRLLESLGFEVHLAGALGGRSAAIQRVPRVRAVLTNGSLGLTGDEIANLPDVEIICAIGAGYETIDVDLATQRGIVVTNGAGTERQRRCRSRADALAGDRRHDRAQQRGGQAR